MSDWISVDERMPDLEGLYLIAKQEISGTEEPFVRLDNYLECPDGNKGFFSDSIGTQELHAVAVTHWMAIPALPETP